MTASVLRVNGVAQSVLSPGSEAEILRVLTGCRGGTGAAGDRGDCFLGALRVSAAAARKRRRKVGHSIWLGAGQATAWRRPSRSSLN